MFQKFLWADPARDSGVTSLETNTRAVHGLAGATARMLPVFRDVGDLSAAQNGPLAQTCTQCGAANNQHAVMCLCCHARLLPAQDPPVVGHATPTEGSLAVQPDWRQELAVRLHAYRIRHGRQWADRLQPALPFQSSGRNEKHRERQQPSDLGHTYFPGSRSSTDAGNLSSTKGFGRGAVERMEITVQQPELDVRGAERRPAAFAPLLPVASLRERRHAGLLDGMLVLAGGAGALGLFVLLGGRIGLGTLDVLTVAAIGSLFYAQYFAAFTALGRSTPGMRARRMYVVNFDGNAPRPGQLLWRSFGYLLSGGTAMLGFLWALWDEDHLTWHDRISQTYLTQAPHQGPL